MNLGEVDVAHVVRAVVVANLPTCPVYALNFDDFIVLDRADRWNWCMLVEG